jgi:CMP-2-keto-3-deoxyoctulosonic acid synthetase
MSIHLVTLAEAPPSGVDTPEDLERVREAAARGGRALSSKDHRTA